MTRTEAKAAGLKTYWSNKPCQRGHVCERYVSSCGCVECQKDNQHGRYHADIEESRRRKRERTRDRWANEAGFRESELERRAIKRQNNPEFRAQQTKAHQDWFARRCAEDPEFEPKYRENHRAYMRDYYQRKKAERKAAKK